MCDPLKWILSALLFSHTAFATVELTSPLANIHTGNYSYYFLSDGAAAAIIPDTGYRKWNLTTTYLSSNASDEMLQFDVRSTKTDFEIQSGQLLVVTIKAVNGSTTALVPVAAAGSTGSTPLLCSNASNTTCTDYTLGGYHFAAVFPMGQLTPIRIGILPKDICAYFYTTGLPAPGCATSAVTTDGTPISLTIQFSVVASNTSAPQVNPTTGGVDTQNFNLYFSTLAAELNDPTTYCTNTLKDYYYYPGDGQLVVDSGEISRRSGYSLAGSIVPVAGVLAVAQVGAPPTVSSQSDLVADGVLTSRVPYGLVGGVSGVTNSTNTDTTSYGLRLFIRDQAGAIQTGKSCDISGAMATGIDGFLSQNACFIATAAYGDPHAWSVEVLRHFRDKVLSSPPLSRVVRWYYRWSPHAATWLHGHPRLKPLVRHLLWPVVAVASALILIREHPIECLFYFAFWIVMILTLALRRRYSVMVGGSICLALFWFAHFLAGPSAQAQEQPYIDEIKRTLPKEPSSPTYLESIRSKLQDEKPQPSIIESIQSTRPESSSDDSTGYTEKEKLKLDQATPKASDDALPLSAIEAVRAGKSDLKMRFDRNIRGAAGIHTSVSRQLSISGNSSVQANSFQDIYGSAWAPEVLVFYEFQPFHSEIFGNFGIVGTVGFSSHRGTGRYQKTDILKPSGGTFGATARVPFQFVTLPVSLGLNYRFNLLYVIRPFVEASAVLAGLLEMRDDGKPTRIGLSKALVFGGGVAVLLDFLSPRASWDLQNDSGVKHSYLIARYNITLPIASSVNLAMAGFYSGLAFEF